MRTFKRSYEHLQKMFNITVCSQKLVNILLSSRPKILYLVQLPCLTVYRSIKQQHNNGPLSLIRKQMVPVPSMPQLLLYDFTKIFVNNSLYRFCCYCTILQKKKIVWVFVLSGRDITSRLAEV